MDHAANVVMVTESGNSFDSTSLQRAEYPPQCRACGQSAHPERWQYRPNTQSDCGLVQIGLSYRVTTRRKLKRLVIESGLPQEEFARQVLAVNPTTLWRYLNGTIRIPREKLGYINSITRISRQGTSLQVESQCPDRPRWRWMHICRKRTGTIAPLRWTVEQMLALENSSKDCLVQG